LVYAELIESVLFEHAQKRFNKQKCRIKSCASKGNAIDNVVFASLVPFSPKNKQFVNFFFDLNKYYPEINRRNAQLNNDRLCDEIRQNIQEGIQQGLYRSDFDLELMVRFLGMQFNTLMDITPGEISHQGLQLVMDCYVRVLCNLKGLDYYAKLLAERSREKPVEEEPLKDEELDYMIDKFLDNENHRRQYQVVSLERSGK